MKKVLLAINLFFLVATVMAQATLPVHVGINNKYPIGNKDIAAKIYVLFLNEKAKADQYHFFYQSKYYESDFMGTNKPCSDSSKKLNALNDCIDQYIQTDNWFSPTTCYILILGHEEDIIDGLSSAKVQQEFQSWYSEWLNNPTWDEVNEYCNDKLKGAAGDAEAEQRANEIAQKYPNTANVETLLCPETVNEIVPQHQKIGPISKNIFSFCDDMINIIYHGMVYNFENPARGKRDHHYHLDLDFGPFQTISKMINATVTNQFKLSRLPISLWCANSTSHVWNNGFYPSQWSLNDSVYLCPQLSDPQNSDSSLDAVAMTRIQLVVASLDGWKRIQKNDFLYWKFFVEEDESSN